MKELAIFIVGGPRSGKTTIAEEVYTLLSDLGLDTRIADRDITPPAGLHEQRLQALKDDGLIVKIATLQSLAVRIKDWAKPEGEVQ